MSELLLDLGPAPLSNALVATLDAPETLYPLRVYVCDRCFLVQISSVVAPGVLFDEEYAYFTSASAPAVDHARMYAECAIIRHGLDSSTRVVEIASNDGYLLQHFVHRGVPVLGIEPAANVAQAAIAKGIDTKVAFFGAELAATLEPVKLIVANNVLAHVPNLHDFIEGLRILLAPGGRISIEFPHVLELLRGGQFDTIYHEHYSYFSLTALAPIFEAHGLSVIDVETLATHGGSLRLTVAHRTKVQSLAVAEVMSQEWAYGLTCMYVYHDFVAIVRECRERFLSFLSLNSCLKIAGYGAPAKAATFLNYCGVRADRIPWTVDSTPHKQGKYLPGSRIPIYPEAYVETHPVDLLVIFSWNWAEHIVKRAKALGHAGKCYIAVPKMTSLEP